MPPPDQPRLPVADPEAKTSAHSHTVRKGETLPMIAKRYGTSVAELKHINQLRGDKVAIGSHLTLTEASAKPEKSTASKATIADAKPEKASGKAIIANARLEKIVAKATIASAKSVKNTAKPTEHASRAPKVTHYTIRHGDTLFSIAKHFNVDKDDLLRWNRVSPNALTPGQTLTIQLAQNP